MKYQLARLYTGVLFLLASMVAAPMAMAADKEFAEAKIVLQISDPNPFKQTLVLNVASNLIKHYGQDQVVIEIVAFGPGLRLLFADNSNSQRVSALANSGVSFSACANTQAKMTQVLGDAPVLHNKAVTVSAGVVRIIELTSQGYTLVKP